MLTVWKSVTTWWGRDPTPTSVRVVAGILYFSPWLIVFAAVIIVSVCAPSR